MYYKKIKKQTEKESISQAREGLLETLSRPVTSHCELNQRCYVIHRGSFWHRISDNCL